MDKIEIEYAGFINSSGYGTAAQDYVLSLYNCNQYNIAIKAFGGKPASPAVSDERFIIFNKMIEQESSDDAIQLLHCIPTMQKRVKNIKKRNMGFAVFETFAPPDNWIHILNKNDAIITPSLFNYRIFAHARIQKPIFYFPHCINMEVFNTDVKPLKKYEKFTFLFLGTWKERKGYKQLLEAWYNEFDDKDNVQLVIKTDKVKHAQKYVEKIKKQFGMNRGFAPVLFETKVFSEIELPRFMKSVDAFISPHLGEGFGLPGLQCMALGVPVIITNFAGSQDYANKDTATLIEPHGFTFYKNMDNIPQFRNKKWAFITIEDIRKALRRMLNNPKEIKNKILYANEYVKEKFNYKISQNLFKEIIESVYGI